ncbi:hypothetical protein [Lapillicoccus sp.]|uniref:hypothetical protein n=1 Tax=Lapillicoccus sp. TaxID=1909287 RepID=UPI00326618A0
MLSPGDRRSVDEELAATLGVDGTHPFDGGLARLGDKELVRQVKAVAYRVDAACVLARSVRAVSERRVTIRPAPDTMTYVTALLPVAQGVAVHAALTAATAHAGAGTAHAGAGTAHAGAGTAHAGAGAGAGSGGDVRSKGQLMADTLVCRVPGQDAAAAVPVEVQLVITDRALLAATGPGSDTLQPHQTAPRLAGPNHHPRPRHQPPRRPDHSASRQRGRVRTGPRARP